VNYKEENPEQAGNGHEEFFPYRGLDSRQKWQHSAYSEFEVGIIIFFNKGLKPFFAGIEKSGLGREEWILR